MLAEGGLSGVMTNSYRTRLMVRIKFVNTIVIRTHASHDYFTIEVSLNIYLNFKVKGKIKTYLTPSLIIFEAPLSNLSIRSRKYDTNVY